MTGLPNVDVKSSIEARKAFYLEFLSGYIQIVPNRLPRMIFRGFFNHPWRILDSWRRKTSLKQLQDLLRNTERPVAFYRRYQIRASPELGFTIDWKLSHSNRVTLYISGLINRLKIFIKSCQGFQVILGYVCYLKFDVGNVSFDINVSLNIFLFYKSWLKKLKINWSKTQKLETESWNQIRYKIV